MTVGELSKMTTLSWIMIRTQDGKVHDYEGSGDEKNREIATIEAKRYPMFDHVLEVTLRE